MNILKDQHSPIVRILFLKITFLLFLPLQAQEIYYDNSELLRNTIVEIENQVNGEDQAYASTQLNGLDAWVDDSELKWSNSDINDFDAQKLSFEVKLKNKEQIRIEQQLLNLGQSKVALKFTGLLEKRLKTAYLSLIDYMEQKQRKNLLQQQRNLANSELDSWKIKVNSKDFRADKLQQADLTLDSIWADQLENNVGISRYESRWHKSDSQMFTHYFERSSNNIIAIQQMLEIGNEVMQSKKYRHSNNSIKSSEFDANWKNKQIQRRNAQNKLSLNSVKFEYDNKKNDLGFSIGVKMPITQNSYDSLLQQQQQRYTNIDMQYSMIEVADQLDEKLFQLMKMQDQWSSNQKLLAKISQRIKRLSKIRNIDLLLSLKQAYLKRQMRQEAIQMRALRIYIEFLNIAGILSEKPYRNWIQTGTPQLFN